MSDNHQLTYRGQTYERKNLSIQLNDYFDSKNKTTLIYRGQTYERTHCPIQDCARQTENIPAFSTSKIKLKYRGQTYEYTPPSVQ
jgi:hypothetical protein